MYKKTLLSVAIASALSLTGCLDTTDPENNPKERDNENSQTTPPSSEQQANIEQNENNLYPVFNPATGEFPKPNDLLLQTTDPDGSYAIPGLAEKIAAGTETPPEVALEYLSGASLTAPIDIEIGQGIAGSDITDTINTDTVIAESFINVGGAPVPNPAQSVFLLELEYAGGDPLKGLVNEESPTVTDAITAAQASGGDLSAAGELLGIAASPKYSAEVITRDKVVGGERVETSYIRIQPLEPLNPNKRYIVALTDEIKDTEGKSLIKHPGIANYAALADENREPANPLLDDVQAQIDFWEKVTASYLGNLTNAARPDDQQLTEDNIVFTSGFTTSNDTKVVDYMVDPTEWATNTVKTLVTTGAAKAAVDAGAEDYATIKGAVDTAISNWTAESFNPALAGCDTYPAGDARFACAGTGMITAAKAGGMSFPEPAADDSVAFDTPRDLRTVSAFITDAIAPVGAVNISEGSLTIPYYSGVPDTRGVSDGTEARLVGEWWKADSTLATQINTAFNLEALGAALPQATTSNVVNHLFPFPAKNSTEEIPVLAIFPADDSNMPADGYKTVIYQHGITTDRSVALALGSAIVANSGGTVAVLAIDQPLHGIDAISEEGRLAYAAQFLAGGQLAGFPESLAPGDTNNQALVDGTLATTFVTTSLDSATVIDASDGISAAEADLITETFAGTIAETVVTGQLHGSLIDITDGIDGTEAGYISAALSGDLTYNVVAAQLNGTLIDITDGIDGTEDATINGTITAALGDASGNPTLDATVQNLTALEAAASSLQSLQLAAQGLGLMQNTIENGASQIPGLGQGSADERHFGFGGGVTNVVPMDFADGTVGSSSSDPIDCSNTGSGAFTINPLSFLTSRDNFRQHMSDLMTLRLSIPTMDIDGIDDNGPEGDGFDLNGDDVHFIAHSLGTFNGIPFVEIANQTSRTEDNIVSANFLTPGGNIARLAENSPVFAPGILLALQSAAGLQRGDADLETFLNVLQASFDSFDPINFVGNLSSTTSTTKALFSEVVGDVFIPNNASPAVDVVQPANIGCNANPYAGISLGEGTAAPLAGTSPLQTASGAVSIGDSTDEASINFIRFESDSGALHTTPAAA
ncbi:hypothetical protein A3766_12465, partial [Oleiphilus sp. HI0132]